METKQVGQTLAGQSVQTLMGPAGEAQTEQACEMWTA
jgi:hypothetical protein